MGLNAGHDLSLENLRYFHENIPWVDEVSIGHALICDALYLGLKKTIEEYKTASADDDNYVSGCCPGRSRYRIGHEPGTDEIRVNLR